MYNAEGLHVSGVIFKITYDPEREISHLNLPSSFSIRALNIDTKMNDGGLETYMDSNPLTPSSAAHQHSM
ncbi:hypothetical protein TNCT_481241, partial [Trichonephila clavata]